MIRLNPEKQIQLTDSKLTNFSKLIAYQTYSKQKRQRQAIESQRKNIQLYVANLFRQTKKASKQLSKTQIALIQKLNRKSSKQKQERQKQELKRLKQEEIHMLKNNNSLCRYMNMLKKQEAKRELLQQKKQLTLLIKQREQHQEQLRKMREVEQNKMLFEKKTALERNLKAGIQLAKTKSLFEKMAISSSVRNDLLQLENKKIVQQKQVIEGLKGKRKELSQLFSKAKRQKTKYQTLMNVGKYHSFREFYDLVAAKEGIEEQKPIKKKRGSRRKRMRSSQNIILSKFLEDQHEF